MKDKEQVELQAEVERLTQELARAEKRIAATERLADYPPGDCEGEPCIWPVDLRFVLDGNQWPESWGK